MAPLSPSYSRKESLERHLSIVSLFRERWHKARCWPSDLKYLWCSMCRQNERVTQTKCYVCNVLLSHYGCFMLWHLLSEAQVSFLFLISSYYFCWEWLFLFFRLYGPYSTILVNTILIKLFRWHIKIHNKVKLKKMMNK